MPSILKGVLDLSPSEQKCFKPCYKWNAFNTRVLEKKLGTSESTHKF